MFLSSTDFIFKNKLFVKNSECDQEIPQTADKPMTM